MPAKYAPILFKLLLSGFMSLMVSGEPVPKFRVWMPPVMQEGNWLWLVLLSAVVCPAF